ncbi:PAS domain S-box protein [Oscillatoria sp. CS-180]|uniref:PAS domain S-box protein n=1 Tax=Oscillatoria sp. CS-180 TaxID=3021720 RepID=UPI0023305DF8|nr:adenylate/guanylate cyclase domain-containing protein [Oscillatoria sp. CS-180]MDB9524957.1 PAS domain S-box protein [Oscillatoria sp. CS-180]
MTERSPLSQPNSDAPLRPEPSILGDERMRQEIIALRREVTDLKLELNKRTQALRDAKEEAGIFKQKFAEQTAALRESNDTLVAEVVERSQAETKLRTARDQLQAILDAVPGIVSWISDDLRYLGVNNHLAKTFNMPVEAFVGQDIGFLHTSNQFNKFVQEFFQSSQIDAYREISAQVAGDQRRFLIVAQKYNQGKAAFTVGIDITERDRAETALREAEAKYRNIFENAVEGIFQTTTDGHYISANPSLARIYGYKSTGAMMLELTNVQQQLYVAPERRREFVQALNQNGSVTDFESQVYKRDGTVIWISENARSVFDRQGDFLYYEGTVEDITKRKEAEAALQQANEELEQRVARRTAALTESNQRLLSEIRERHRIEDALRASEAELRALFAAMTDVITVFDGDGRYLNMVATNSQLLYSPSKERVGQTVYDVLPPYQASLFMRHIQQALNTRKPVRLEYSLPIGDWQQAGEANGQTAPDDFKNSAWYLAIISPMHDNRVIWVARDITEKRRADIALQKAEEKYRSIFENSVEGIFQASPDARYLSVNPALARMYGYLNPAEMMQRVLNIDYLYVHEDIRQLMLHRLHHQGAVFEFESQVYRADGHIIWVSESVRVVKDDRGRIQYYEGTVADITQRRQAQEALRESQRTLETLLGNLVGMAYRRHCDHSWTLEFVSEGCYELTGYTPSDLLGENAFPFEQLIHPDDRAYVRGELEQVLPDGNPFRMTYRILTADGQEKWVLEKGIPVSDSVTQPTIVEGFLTDITDRKEIEEALMLEQERSERLLLNILPASIADQLKRNTRSIAYRFEEVTILFADIVNFTELAADMMPTELVDLLNEIFSAFDHLAERHQLEKIKTIGDAYMVVGGVPSQLPNHTKAIAEMALDMQTAIAQFKRQDRSPFRLRIGIDTGPVVAGVIGLKKFSYDLWGDAVNVASRMETQGLADCIQVTASVYDSLRDEYVFEERGVIDVKGKGEMLTYWLKERKDQR